MAPSTQPDHGIRFRPRRGTTDQARNVFEYARGFIEIPAVRGREVASMTLRCRRWWRPAGCWWISTPTGGWSALATLTLRASTWLTDYRTIYALFQITGPSAAN